jgi:hypothetical protein
MRIKVDEDLPAAVASLLREHAYQADSVFEQGIRPLVELITRVISEYTLERFSGTIAVVTPRGIRTRRVKTNL